MKKHLLLLALLCLGSLAIAQTKEHKTLTKDFDMGAVGDSYHVFPCVLTVSYYQNEQGKTVYDGPFSIVGEGQSPYVTPWGSYWGPGESKLSYEAHGCYVEGKLNGEISITRKEEFRSKKGEEAPRYWTFMGSFDKGVPTGKWDYSYFTTYREQNNPKSITRKEVIDSFHMTFKNGYPIKFDGFCLAGRGEFSHRLWGEVFKLDLFEKVNIKGEISENGKPNGEWTGIIENTKFQNGIALSSSDKMANDLAVQYLSGKLSLEEIEDKGYVIDDYSDYYKYADKDGKCLNMTYFWHLLNEEYLKLNMNMFKNGMELNVCDDSYWKNTIKSWGCIEKKDGSFWTPSQVNAYIDKIQQVNSFMGDYDWGISQYSNDLENKYRRHEIKTVHYKNIKAVLDGKKSELEEPIVNQMKRNISEKTSMEELNSFMKSKSDEIGLFSENNKKTIENAYKSKFEKLEKKEFDAALGVIKGNFDNELMGKLISNYPKKAQYLAFEDEYRSKIDEALRKQPQAIEASAALKKALDQIVAISQNRKITKKPVEIISADYNSNPSNWAMFSGQSIQEQLPVKIAPFCPMSEYKIIAADYLKDGGFSYSVEWTQQISKKEQKKYISNFKVSKDKIHVELDSFDFAKAIEK